MSIAALGCLTPEQDQCLAGPRSGCSCVSDECPPSDSACYPDGDCPAAVVAEAGEAARCLRLDPEDFGAGFGSEVQCLCGCFGCAAVCDGAGPVYGIVTDGLLDYGTPFIRIADRMPAQGTLGVYMRLRGLSDATLAVLTGDANGAEDLATFYPVAAPIDTEFRELVYLDQAFFQIDAYAWAEAAKKPTHLALIPAGSAEQPAVTLLEIDCVIPFLVP